MSEKLPDGWKRVKLGEVGKVITGTTPSKNNPDYWGNSVLFVTPTDYKNYNKWCYDSERKLSMIGEKALKNKLLPPKSIMVSCIGSDMGKVAVNFYPAITNQQINSIIIDESNAYFDFIYYLLKSMEENLKALGHSRGSALPILNKSTFESIEIIIPEDITEQKAIASVLSSIDDKIDLLHRQNQTLEKMAETLFRKWFIEDAKEDWEEVSLGDSDLATIISSGIEKFEGEKIYLETGDVKDTNITGGTKITYESRPSRANMQPIRFSVWFAKKGGVRKLLMFDDYSDTDKYILSTGFSGLKTNELSHYYIWCFILTKEFQEIKDSLVSGSVQPDITNEGIRQIMIFKPDSQTLIKFNEVVKPIFYKYQRNKEQIRTLENLRDTLLPKLMSGEMRVRLGVDHA